MPTGKLQVTEGSLGLARTTPKQLCPGGQCSSRVVLLSRNQWFSRDSQKSGQRWCRWL